MSHQITDTIIVNNIKYRLFSQPIEPYWEKYNNKPKLFSLVTANTRGYWAMWLLEDDRLYLVDFRGINQISIGPPSYSFQDLFPHTTKVFAEWYTGELIVAVGETEGSFNSEKYKVIMKVESGSVVDTNIFDMV